MSEDALSKELIETYSLERMCWSFTHWEQSLGENSVGLIWMYSQENYWWSLHLRVRVFSRRAIAALGSEIWCSVSCIVGLKLENRLLRIYFIFFFWFINYLNWEAAVTLFYWGKQTFFVRCLIKLSDDFYSPRFKIELLIILL